MLGGAEVLDRTNTNFPSQLTDLLRRALASMKDDEVLRYYQYLAKVYMTDPVFGVGQPGGPRGLLIYHLMGMGKTYLALAIAMAMSEQRRVVIMAPKAVQGNFERSIDSLLRRMYPEASDIEEKIAKMRQKIKLVSQNAHNTVDQVIRATAFVTPKKNKPGERVGALDGALLIVDEAHNFFRAIINSANSRTNARELYNIIMNASNLRILFLSGTPIAKNPFELVPCFNMLAGRDILPPLYGNFADMFLGKDGVKNKALLANRIFGLVSYIGYKTRLAKDIESAAAAHEQSSTLAEPRSDGGFPEVFPNEVLRIQMAPQQYWEYLQIRTKEAEESKGFKGRDTPALALPGSERQGGSTYHVRSRAHGNFAPPNGYKNLTDPDSVTQIDLSTLPDSTFTAETSPKMSTAVDIVMQSPGPVVIYSQFKGIGGLAPMSYFLKKAGFSQFSTRKSAGASNNFEELFQKTGLTSDEHDYAYQMATQEHSFDPDKDCFMPSVIVGEEEGKPEITYRLDKTEKGLVMPGILSNLHLGQRKLFVTELWFLSHYLRRYDNKAVVVYVGAASGAHIKILLNLFPNVEWHLYDPAKFVIKTGPKVKIYNQFFEDKDTKKWAGKCDFFISDIRLNADDQEKFEKGVSDDMKMQLKWTLAIKPRVAAMLKFRPPYIDPGDPLQIKYLRGRCLRQSWAPKSSTETRLIVDAENIDKKKLVSYNVDRYQDWCAQYNVVDRPLKRHCRPVGLRGNVLDTRQVPGFDRCPDCMNELYAWYRYNLMEGRRHLHNFAMQGMNLLSSKLGQPLLRPWKKGLGKGVGHGKFPQHSLGADAMADVLQSVYDPRNKFPLDEIQTMYGGATKALRFAFITGDTHDVDQDAIEMAWNSPENIHGDVIKVLMLSQRGTEGLDLRYGRHVIALESYWDLRLFKQLAMRVARPGSHDLLPKEERDVHVTIMIAVPNAELKESMEVARENPENAPLSFNGDFTIRDLSNTFREDMTIDEQLYTRAEHWSKIIDTFLELLREVSIECTLMEDGRCYTCRPTNTPLFQGSVLDDKRLPNPCSPMRESKVQAKPIELDGKKYYHREDPTTTFGHRFYEYSDTLRSYVEIGRDTPLYLQLWTKTSSASSN